MADDSCNYHRHISPHISLAKGHNIMGTFILSQTPRPRNGSGNIPTNDNRILIKTTRHFSLLRKRMEAQR